LGSWADTEAESTSRKQPFRNPFEQIIVAGSQPTYRQVKMHNITRMLDE
jgi:hypothetical protein